MKTPELIAEQRQAAAKRRDWQRSPERTVADKLLNDLNDYLDARAKGMSVEDAAKGLEATLREAIPPSPYTRPYVCETCSDTGFEPCECDGSAGAHGPTCGRQSLHDAHHYVRTCFCEKGAKMNQQKVQADAEQAAIAAAAKPRKRTSWSRMGTR